MNTPESSKIDELLFRIQNERSTATPQFSAGSTVRSSPNHLQLQFETRRRPQNLPFAQHSHRSEQLDKHDEKLKEIMKISGRLKINRITYNTDSKDLECLEELGNGTCGHVVKMKHKLSGKIIAVKQMRRTGNRDENKRIVMDLEVVIKSHECRFIVQCLGCFIMESEVWICMELMATCFDKLLKRLKQPIPEDILGKVTVATVKALAYLKEVQGIIHRDVKPSNILLDEVGNIKLCDFGISGRLVDSMAATKSAGCTAYLAPERIEIDPNCPDYDVRADIWSLGITLVELATGVFPYQDCKTDFELLSKVIDQDPPTLPDDKQFTPEFRHFVNSCLIKDQHQRPKYKKLMEEPFYKTYETADVNVGDWFLSTTEASVSDAVDSSRQTSSAQTRRPAHIRQHSEPPPHSPSVLNGCGRQPPIHPADSSKCDIIPDRKMHVSRIASYQRDSMTNERPSRNCSPFQAYQQHLQAKNSSNSFSGGDSMHPYTSPVLQRRTDSSTSPYFQRRDRWNSPGGSPLPLRNHIQGCEEATVPYNCGNTSPIVLQRFYHQQKQQQQAKAEENAKSEQGLGRKRIASYIKLQLNSDRSGRTSRHQSPEPPPRLNRSDNPSPLTLRRHFFEGNATSQALSKRYISPAPPVPPPRRLSESTSMPGSPQHVRARFHYTPEPQRRLFQNNDIS